MCFLTDAFHLYKNALGLYDLELTLLVAQQAQMVRTYSFLCDGDSYMLLLITKSTRILANIYHS